MKKQKIIDSFIFFNELDLLEYRLELLYDKVDHFILVESNISHTGESKPLYFTIHKKRFAKYLDKIVHIIVTDVPKNLTQSEIDELVELPEIRNINWVREHHQRRAIERGLKKIDVTYDDIIFVSDVDEIPDLDKLDEINKLLPYGPVVCQQRWFIWSTKWEKDYIWLGSTAFSYSHYLNNNDIFQHIRNRRWDENSPKFTTVVSGWHFSWFGTPDFIKTKMFAFAHTETATDFFNYKRNIVHLMSVGLPPELPKFDTERLTKVTGGYLPPMRDKVDLFDVESFPKRYDCVIFNDEIEMLEFRLQEMEAHLDYFVVVESRFTHTGQPKELVFDKYKDRFAKYDKKLIYAVVEEFPETPEGDDPNWFRENYHRNSIKDVLISLNIRDQDYILISDVDEIFDSPTFDATISEYEHIEYDFLTVKHRSFHWNFDWQFNEPDWYGTQITKWEKLKNVQPQDYRNMNNITNHYLKNYRGWHLSWFGNTEQLINRQKSVAFQEIEKMDSDEINNRIEKGISVYGESNLSSTEFWEYFPKNKLLLEEKLFPLKNNNTNYLLDIE
tara:strand:- start:3157 stop:4827 length:1671 start_codon:yes stop_codon:yes gene_type:complete